MAQLSFPSFPAWRAGPRAQEVLKLLSSRWHRWRKGQPPRRTGRAGAGGAAQLEQAAREACAVEGSELRYGHTVIDGRRYAALFRQGELVGLLPPER